MLLFSRLVLNEREREVRRDLADCYGLHRRILKAFPQVEEKGNVREQFGLLYRIESPQENRTGWCVLVQSGQEPDWSGLPAGYVLRQPEVKRIDEMYGQITNGMVFRFRLRANPTKRIGRKDDPRWEGRRVALRSDDEQLQWLGRKGEQSGFALLPVRSNGQVADVRGVFEPDVKGRRNVTLGDPGSEMRINERLTFGSALFEGFLQVSDAESFKVALARGIGSGKAFGFGLLSLAQAR